ncbi:MAG TPA: NUDIX hydrolase [Candidatus Saccharimonadales bacterium]|nr:NUDIX hydrolase [Candidatus Saccharimonadales bacterium]
MSKNKPKWVTHSTEEVYQNKWFKVEKAEVTRPNGEKGDYYTIVSPSVAFIIPQDNDGGIYLIGQRRYPINEYSLEIPAGRIEREEPLAAAKRELQEETGFSAQKWEKLGEFYSANGLLREKAYVFLATGLKQTGENEQEEEGIDQVVKLSLEKITEMIRKDEIKDGQTMSSLMLFLAEKGLIKK